MAMAIKGLKSYNALKAKFFIGHWKSKMFYKCWFPLLVVLVGSYLHHLSWRTASFGLSILNTQPNFSDQLILLFIHLWQLPTFTISVFQILGHDPLMGNEINLVMIQDEA